MDTSEISPRFNKKLTNAINSFAANYNIERANVRILLVPKTNTDGNLALAYKLKDETAPIADVTFEDIVKLDALEKAFINKKKIENFILNSFVKFAIGANLDVTDLNIVIYLSGNEIHLKILYLTAKKYGKHFSVDNLF